MRRSPLPASGNTLLLVAKSPEPGTVKTRLAGDTLPQADAVRLASAFLQDAAQTVASPLLPARAVLAVSGDPAFLPVSLATMPRVVQESGDLGDRLTGLFAASFATPGTRAVCAIGSDTPHLPLVFLIEAFARLRSPQETMVLGETDNGGYYLVGINRFRPELFAGIAGGTNAVAAQTRERARAAGLLVSLLPPWYDVGTPASLERLRRDAKRGIVTAPGTMDVLEG